MSAVDTIKEELKERLEQLYSQNKLVEAQRLAQRTQFDLEMMAEVGFATVSKTTRGISPARRRESRRRPCSTTCRPTHCWSSTSRM